MRKSATRKGGHAVSNLSNQLVVAEREDVARGIRLLLANPLISERSSAEWFDLVRRRREPIRQWFDYYCGWTLIVEPRFGYALDHHHVAVFGRLLVLLKRVNPFEQIESRRGKGGLEYGIGADQLGINHGRYRGQASWFDGLCR